MGYKLKERTMSTSITVPILICLSTEASISRVNVLKKDISGSKKKKRHCRFKKALCYYHTGITCKLAFTLVNFIKRFFTICTISKSREKSQAEF